jgi:hypothetical protein
MTDKDFFMIDSFPRNDDDKLKSSPGPVRPLEKHQSSASERKKSRLRQPLPLAEWRRGALAG